MTNVQLSAFEYAKIIDLYYKVEEDNYKSDNLYKKLCYCLKRFGFEDFDSFVEWNYNHYKDYNIEEIKSIQKELHNKYVRLYRLEQCISFMLSNYECAFLTLTFNEKALSKSTDEYKRALVSRFLKKLTRSDNKPNNYVANVDYGEKNGRLHYHAIINLDKLSKEDLSKWTKTYGFIKVKPIKIKNYKALSKYILKLGYHCIKDTTKNQSLIYSDGLNKKVALFKKARLCELDTLKLK